MTTVWRRVRGALGTALLWGVVGAVGEIGYAIYFVLRRGDLRGDNSVLLAIGQGASYFGLTGVAAGVLFSAWLAYQSRGRSIHELRPARLFLQGFAAGVVGFAIFLLSKGWIEVLFGGLVVPEALLIGVVAGSLAAGTLKLAQSASGEVSGYSVLDPSRDEVAALLDAPRLTDASPGLWTRLSQRFQRASVTR